MRKGTNDAGAAHPSLYVIYTFVGELT